MLRERSDSRPDGTTASARRTPHRYADRTIAVLVGTTETEDSMGFLIYGAAPAIEIEDRVLRHVQLVVIQKLRRNESFAFNWDREPGVGSAHSAVGSPLDDASEGASHGSVWISQHSQLYFRYDGKRDSRYNPAWLELMMQATYRPEGLSVIPEPTDNGHRAEHATPA
jgi:hypothetical protein